MKTKPNAAPSDTKALVPANAPAGEGAEVVVASDFMNRFAAMAGAGAENITADAKAVPFLRLLQAKSPEVENDGDNYRAGMLVHSITGERYDIREKGGNPLPFLLCHFHKEIVEWGDKDAGNGGIKKRHACTPAALTKLATLPRKEGGTGKGAPVLPSGNTLVETAYHDVVLLTPEGPVAGCLPLKSSGLTPSKKLMHVVDSQVMTTPDGKSFKPPTFAKVYAVQSFLDKQKTGAQNTFQNVRFQLIGTVTDEASLMMAEEFYKSIQAGHVVRDDEQKLEGADAPAEGSEAPENGSGAPAPSDDDVPF